MSVFRTVSLSTNGVLQGLNFKIPINQMYTNEEVIKSFKYIGCSFFRTLGMEYAAIELHNLQLHYHGPNMYRTEPDDIIWICSHCPLLEEDNSLV